jgi:hypothetical protein
MPKLTYCWRTTHQRSLGSAATLLDKTIESTLRDIVVAGGPHFGDFQLSLSTLPVSMGGLGIFLASDVAAYAYTASILSSMSLQNDILRIQRDFIPPPVLTIVDEFATSIYPKDPDKALKLSSETMAPQSKHQHSMAHVFYTAKRSLLLKHDFFVRSSVDMRRRFQVILDSAAQPVASAWLFAIPNSGMNQRLTALEFQVAASFRLLIPQFPSGQSCNRPTCTVSMDVFGYHSAICHGRERFARHQNVRDALSDLASMARFSPINDANVKCLGFDPYSRQTHGYRPADILMAGDSFERDCVDVTVVCPFATSMTGGAPIPIGKKVNAAEADKYRKHEEACKNASFGFKAFAIDVFGVTATRSLELLYRIRNAIVRTTGTSMGTATAICHRRISIALQRSVARQVLAQLAPVPDFRFS